MTAFAACSARSDLEDEAPFKASLSRFEMTIIWKLHLTEGRWAADQID